MLLLLGGVGGADVWVRLLEKLPEGTEEMALADVHALFGGDLPVGSGWELDDDAARSLYRPTLLALASGAGPIPGEQRRARGLLADVEHLDVVGAGCSFTSSSQKSSPRRSPGSSANYRPQLIRPEIGLL